MNLSIIGKTQVVSRVGIDLGLITSTSQKFTSIYGSSYFAPSMISPVLGVKWLYSKSKYFEFSGGVQYGMFGTRFKGFNMPVAPYTYSEKITFHKLCFPLTVGLNTKVSDKLNTIVSAGLRPHILVSGKYFVERNEQTGSQTYTHQYSYNPLISEWGLNPVERFGFQYTIGISGRFKQNDISINYNLGYPVRFGRVDYPSYYRELKNNELTISLIHLPQFFELNSREHNEGPEEKVYFNNSIGIYFGYLEVNMNYEKDYFDFPEVKIECARWFRFLYNTQYRVRCL